jgi:hypothetical protein
MIIFLIVDFGTTYFIIIALRSAINIFPCPKAIWGQVLIAGRRARPVQGGRMTMGKRDDLIAQYVDNLKNKCGMTPDMVLLTKVTIGCGPAIYNVDASTVAGSQPDGLETVRKNFLIKKLGLADGSQLMEVINSVIEIYGRSERNKYRAVIYYMLSKHFGKEVVYN